MSIPPLQGQIDVRLWIIRTLNPIVPAGDEEFSAETA
jgi:hypothetical protein